MEILVLSNGKGEDSLAVTLLKAMDAPVKIKALPLVGDGRAYADAGIETTDVDQDLPSHGFGGTRISSLLKDIRAGLGRVTLNHVRALKKLSSGADLIICVGDIYPVLLAGLFTGKPIIHVATAISVRIRKYNFAEIALFRKRCRKVFSRDEETASFLRSKGVGAECVGNLMMDDPGLAETGEDLKIPADKFVIGLLPSSRPDARSNTEKMLKVMSHIGRDMNVEHVIATKGLMGDVIRRANLIVGMTGTGNEQAAGLGKPVVLIEHGPAASRKRIRQYEKLLEGAVVSFGGDDKKVAGGIMSLIKDPGRLREMGEAGRKILGGPGAARKMAEAILRELKCLQQ